MDDELEDLTFEEREALRKKVTSEPGVASKKRRRKAKGSGPVEMSSKHPVKVVPNFHSTSTRKKCRDPRFSELSGDYDDDKFSHSYKWLEEHSAEEAQRLYSELKKCKDPDLRFELQSELTKVQQFISSRKKANLLRQVKKKRRRDEMEAVSKGKKPFFLKAKDQKLETLAAEFLEASERKRGGVDKLLKKKKTRQLTKSRRQKFRGTFSREMPKRRRLEEGQSNET